MPVMEVAQAIARRKGVVSLVHSEVWQEGIHSGAVGSTDKKTLLKAGAEMLGTFFGLTPRFVLQADSIEDWTGECHGGEPLFYYRYICQLWRGDMLVAEGAGSCNSRESKYRYRWVGEFDIPAGMDKASLKKRGGKESQFDFAVDEAKTGGKYGKPPEYWQQFRDAIAKGTAVKVQKEMRNGQRRPAWEIDTTVYRIPNDDITSQVNTIDKMAQKRALVAATLLAVNASEFFTQDLEDFEEDGPIVTSTARMAESKPATGAPPEPPDEPPPPPGTVADSAALPRHLDRNAHNGHEPAPEDAGRGGTQAPAAAKPARGSNEYKVLTALQGHIFGAIKRIFTDKTLPAGQDDITRAYDAIKAQLGITHLWEYPYMQKDAGRNWLKAIADYADAEITRLQTEYASTMGEGAEDEGAK
jgi:hypothetical protein